MKLVDMKPSNIGFFVFFGVFSISLVTVNYFNNFYARNALARDAELLLYKFHDSLVESYSVLNSLPAADELQCSDNTKQDLAKLAFDSPSLRLVGIHDSEGQYCLSESVHFDMMNYYGDLLDAKGNRLTDDLYLAVVGKNHMDFLMVKHHQNSSYFASINPFNIDYLSEFTCTNCMDYEFIIDDNPSLAFKGREMTGPAVIDYSSFRYEELIKVTLNLRGTDSFYSSYKTLSWLSSLVFAFFCATGLAILVYKMLSIRQSLERLLRDAIRYKEIIPYYQPIIDSREGQMVGAEVLVRWQRADGTIIPPYQFIPFAEDTGLITDITEELIIKVFEDMKRLNWDSSQLFMSINIVPEHLKTDRLFSFIDQQLKEYNMPSGSLSLELTERLEIDDLSLARDSLAPFLNAGIDIKLDDAGTGYGGFSYVQELGITTLKIDKMFIDTIQRDDVKSSVLAAIIEFAKTSELKIIAEGVETAEQVEYLKEHQVYYIQGYVYAKPMSYEAFSKSISGQYHK